MIRRTTAVMIAMAALLGGCQPWQRVGSEDRPQPGVTLARMFDPASVYRAMGFLVSGPPTSFIGTVRYLKGPVPDSTLTLCALSLANHALSFRREGNEFLAEYHVELSFRPDSGGGVPRELASDHAVRVRTFQETQRIDESVLFQQFLSLRPGVYHVMVAVRDRNGPSAGRAERTDTVPAFAGPGIATPVAVYEDSARSDLRQPPKLLANPRATLPYGGDSLHFYIEAYDLAAGARVLARVMGQNGNALWSDTVRLHGSGAVANATLTLGPEQVPLGQAQLEVETLGGSGGEGGARAVTTPFLVSFSSQWVITNFDEMISLLRYFERQDLVAKLHSAPPEKRAETWRDFWKATDPVPLTPENEALDDYFRRLQVANGRFAESGDPGWLTDRGEVFITLGEPDEVYDLRAEQNRGAVPYIRWSYTNLRLVLLFEDPTGFGRFRMTPSSRAEYQRVLARVRRMG